MLRRYRIEPDHLDAGSELNAQAWDVALNGPVKVGIHSSSQSSHVVDYVDNLVAIDAWWHSRAWARRTSRVVVDALPITR